MPELPEVETVARGLHKRVAGDVIESVWIGDRKQPLKSSPDEIAAMLEGSKIARARRVGKHIAIDLERNGSAEGQWIVHLGMTGSMLVTSPDEPIAKHTHLIAKMRSGKEVRYVDPRMFGKLAVTRETFKAPGSEPLDIGFEIFANLFRKTEDVDQERFIEPVTTERCREYLCGRVAGAGGNTSAKTRGFADSEMICSVSIKHCRKS